ncbi:MAG: FAD-dependent oxidoreductase [Actinomycetota bacterium]|nr:FAD-dependent oxidoreductase [Actinomycetota bacterium]
MDGITRRRLLKDGAAVGAVAVAGVSARQLTAVARRRRRAPTVAILGGGVGGLSAAHELVERGFEVTVYERRALGGKARSTSVPGTARGARRPLPGEHGMRLFPGFYQNLPKTMRQIPDGTNPNGTFDNLVATSQFGLSRDGGREDVLLPVTVNPAPWRLEQLRPALIGGFTQAGAFGPGEVEHFVERLLVFMTSCDARREQQWEPTAWWDFVAAERYSEEYRRVLVNSLTRQLLGAKASAASTRTCGLLWEAFLLNMTGRSSHEPFDRVLDAPTNEAWIDPWVMHLRSRGVRFRLGCHVERLALEGDRVAAARVLGPRGRELVQADWVVCALPVERARRLWSAAVERADPALRRTRRLVTDWMNGLQVYLREPTPILHGHVFYLDSPWGLSSISQAQFWRERDFAREYGDGTVRDCLSVDIANFAKPGILYGRPARELGPKQIKREVMAQIRAHLDDTGERTIPREVVHSWALDPGLVFPKGGGPRNEDPLLINTPGSLPDRPGAASAIPNLLLASDYVRVSVDVACMEGANEAARRAVNILLDRAGSTAERCAVHELFQPPELEPLKAVDEQLFNQGLPNALDRGSG